MHHFDTASTPALSSGEVADIIRLGLEAEHLAQMPQGRLPEKVILYALQQEVQHSGPECIPKIEPLLRAPRPLLRTEWGMLEMSAMEADKDVPASLSIIVYLDDAIADGQFCFSVSEFLPECISDRIDNHTQKHLCLAVNEGLGTLSCAEMIFWFEGNEDAVTKQKLEIAEFLADFIGAFSLDDAIVDAAELAS